MKCFGLGLIIDMYSTEGIVLKKVESGEADFLFTIYTKDFGKIRALARGVKKEGAKLKGHLELYSLSNISFVLGKNGERLTQARLLNFWPSLRYSWKRLTLVGQLLEMVDKNCGEGDKDESIWLLLLGSLNFLEQQEMPDANLSLFSRDFSKRLSMCLGYGGSLKIFK